MNADGEESTFHAELHTPLGARVIRASFPNRGNARTKRGYLMMRRTEKTTHSMMFMQCRSLGCSKKEIVVKIDPEQRKGNQNCSNAPCLNKARWRAMGNVRDRKIEKQHKTHTGKRKIKSIKRNEHESETRAKVKHKSKIRIGESWQS